MARFFTSPKSTAQLRAQLIRQLENEANQLLKQMMAQFTQQLASQAQDVLSKSVSNFGDSSSGGTDGSGGYGINGLSAVKLFSTALSYAMSRPHGRSSTQESSRSQNMRLSSSQAAGQAGSTLSRGGRNL